MNTAILKGNWKEIKGKVKQKWSKLSDDDLNEVEGSYDELEGKLQKLYGYKKQEAKHAIDSFFESSDWKKIAEDAEGIKDAFIRNATHLKDSAEKMMNTSFKEIKDKSTDLQENVVTYVKENPVKSIGFAVIAGILAATLLKK
jgi:uncharacterized protein YjbJ (UPF0337 family)/ElaB/YqjD/DUF883 family membrane-anchored ribosome-binding protein